RRPSCESVRSPMQPPPSTPPPGQPQPAYPPQPPGPAQPPQPWYPPQPAQPAYPPCPPQPAYPAQPPGQPPPAYPPPPAGYGGPPPPPAPVARSRSGRAGRVLLGLALLIPPAVALVIGYVWPTGKAIWTSFHGPLLIPGERRVDLRWVGLE